jgi:hypothetical protein
VDRYRRPSLETERAEWRLARSNIFAFGDQICPTPSPKAQQALAGLCARRSDWPNALPAMSNLGVMHYWRGEYADACAVLTACARAA